MLEPNKLQSAFSQLKNVLPEALSNNDFRRAVAALLPELNDLSTDALSADFSSLESYVDTVAAQLSEQINQQREQPATQRGDQDSDLLLGSGVDNQLYGLAGNDTLYGGGGSNLLKGGTGYDLLIGDRAQDTLIDSDGGDIMFGGEGEDIFHVYDWDLPRTASVILDFEVGTDQIKIGRLASRFEDLSFEQSELGTAVREEEGQIAFLAGVSADSLSADSFIFGDANLAKQLQAGLAEGLAASNTPGATQAIYTPEGFTWEGAAGFSNLAEQKSMQADTVLSIASTTKTFTAATILKLAEAGKLSLDETLGKWLPEVAKEYPGGENFTLRQLLNGTTGIISFDNAEKYASDAATIDEVAEFSANLSQEEAIALTYGEPLFQNNARSSDIWSYTNTTDVIAGLIVEKITGRPFAETMREQVIDPLGLENTSYSRQEPIAGNLSRSYIDFESPSGNVFTASEALQKKIETLPPDATEAEQVAFIENEVTQLQNSLDGVPEDITEQDIKIISALGPAGALFSNAEDTARFTQALFSGELLSDRSLEELFRLQPTETQLYPYYGLGIFSTTLNDEDGQQILLSGDSFGYTSETTYTPDNGNTIITTLANRQFRFENAILPPDESRVLSAKAPIIANTNEVLAA